MGNAVSVLAPPSEESGTEWKEDTEEASTRLETRRVPSIVEKSVRVGG